MSKDSPSKILPNKVDINITDFNKYKKKDEFKRKFNNLKKINLINTVINFLNQKMIFYKNNSPKKKGYQALYDNEDIR